MYKSPPTDQFPTSLQEKYPQLVTKTSVMLTKFSLASVFCLIALAAATPCEPVTRTVTTTAPATTVTAPASACNAGNLQCCNSMQTGATAIAGGLLPLDAVVAILSGGVNQNVGLTCSPIELVGGSTCNSQTLCCSNNQFNGVVSLGCIPVNIAL